MYTSLISLDSKFTLSLQLEAAVVKIKILRNNSL